jgi:hypothetical protein
MNRDGWGSSGRQVDNDLLRFVNNAGTTCRQELVRSCYLMLTFEIGTFSTRAYSQEFKRVRYSPVWGGQVDPEKIEWVIGHQDSRRLMQLLKHCFHTFWQQ